MVGSTCVMHDLKSNKLEVYNVSSYFRYASSVEISREPSILRHFQEIFISPFFLPKRNF